MGRDKRLALIIDLPNRSGYYGYADRIVQSVSAYYIKDNMPCSVLEIKLPSSFSEIILQLDLRCIKWRSITLVDNTIKRGIILRNQVFRGDSVVYYKDLAKTHPEELKEREIKFERILSNYCKGM